MNFTTTHLPEPDIRSAAGPRFDVFYCLNAIFEAPDKRPPGLVAPMPSRRVQAAHERLGGWPLQWIAAADTLNDGAPNAEFEEIEQSLASLAPEQFALRWLICYLHDQEVANTLLSGEAPPIEALAALPAKKREWLGHIGVYPLRSGSAAARSLEILIADPQAARDTVHVALTDFWINDFRDAWREIEQACQDRARRITELFAENDPATAFRKLGLRAEYDAELHELRALRGGYSLAFDEIESINILPSAFNTDRLWTVDSMSQPVRVWFPWFDPSLASNQANSPPILLQSEEPDLDLVFRALGDPTRLAMMELISEQPRGPSELATQLGLARSTISHHLFVLREAGLVENTTGQGRSKLRLRRAPFETLSMRSLAYYFPQGLPSGRSE